jgi:outer membrane protein OmpA-like peptidoglycan-associated protein
LKGRNRAARSIGTCLALSVLATGTALAQYEDEPLPTWYVGPFAGYLFADPDRGADDALNLHLVAGRVLYDAVAVEANFFANKLDASVAGGPETDLMGGGLDLALGVTAQGYPVFLLGAGFLQQDIGGESKSQPFLNLGLGVYLPFSVGRELWRLEGRYHMTGGEHPALPGEDVLDDFRLNLGVLFTFGGDEAPPAPAESRPPPPPPAAEPEPVAPPPAPVEPAPAPAPEPAPPLAPPDTDADDDGVNDADDRCPDTAPGTTVGPNGCVVVEDITMRSAYFGSSSASLTARAYELLRDVAAALQADPGMQIEIEGHSDTSGAAARNVPLSQQRADAVRDFLVSLGVAPHRLVAKGYGAYRPVNDNSTLELRAANRRVQFRRLEGTP